MAEWICGVYGYEITRPFEAGGLRFMPTHSSVSASEAARDRKRYNLTATVTSDRIEPEDVFVLAAILSFVEHLDVVVTDPVPVVEPGAPQFPLQFPAPERHDGGGAMIASDALFPGSRPAFIRAALKLLRNPKHCEATGYRILFFKAAQTFRQRSPFMEVSYFLLFSGLETYVRKATGETKSPIPGLLDGHLRALGFDTCLLNPARLTNSMFTYALLRNALFHNSEFEARKMIGGVAKRFKLTDYLVPFQILVCLVTLKATGFDDGHTNWNAWIDRSLLK